MKVVNKTDGMDVSMSEGDTITISANGVERVTVSVPAGYTGYFSFRYTENVIGEDELE